MASTIVERSAAFTRHVAAAPPPPEVIDETKRIILGAIGCGQATTTSEFGRVGLEYGRIVGAHDHRTEKAHVCALRGVREHQARLGLGSFGDQLPRHVAPYILPVAMGRRVSPSDRHTHLSATDVCLEMCFRLSNRWMTYTTSSRRRHGSSGYSSMSFGLTVASSMMKETSEAATGEELGIVGGTSPVNALRPWQMRLCGRGAEDEPMTKPSTLKTAAVNRSIMSSL